MKRKRRVKKQNRLNIAKEYKESWKYIKDSRKFILFITGTFFIFFLIGLFVPAPDFLYNEIMDFIEELLAKTQAMSQAEITNFIIYNNIQNTFLAIILGVFFGIFPLIDAVANGYVLGFVSSISVANNGLVSLLKLLPHGIFELPAVFISLGLGLRTGMFIFRREKVKALKDYFWNSLKVFLLVVVPLLLIAGVIEGALVFFFK